MSEAVHLQGMARVDSGWGNVKEKKPLGRCRHKYWDNVEMDIQEIGWEWTGLIWLRTGSRGCVW
jgi:hypothetical protein